MHATPDFLFPEFSRLPDQLRPSCRLYTESRRSGDAALRARALTDITFQLRQLSNVKWSRVVSIVLRALDDLESSELARRVLWAPNSMLVYQTLAEHPHANAAVRLALLSRVALRGIRHDPVVSAHMYDYLKDTHPFVVYVFDAQNYPKTAYIPRFSYAELLDAVESQVEDDRNVYHTLAALLPTWTGSADEILGVSRGILART